MAGALCSDYVGESTLESLTNEFCVSRAHEIPSERRLRSAVGCVMSLKFRLKQPSIFDSLLMAATGAWPCRRLKSALQRWLFSLMLPELVEGLLGFLLVRQKVKGTSTGSVTIESVINDQSFRIHC